MKQVGITGGMGCGKSTVLREFAQLGVPCFVADSVAANYYHEPQFLLQLRHLLGNDIFLPNGQADKQAIARKVFADNMLLQQLNALIHPRVMHDWQLFCQQHSAADYALFESAILYDYGLHRQMDKVICVYLSLDQRLHRLAQRDHSSPAELMARINRQLPAEQIMARADYVILNYEGNPRQRQVAIIDKSLRK